MMLGNLALNPKPSTLNPILSTPLNEVKVCQQLAVQGAVFGGFPPFWGSNNKDYSILGSPYFGKLSFVA